jgi:hypothetical protein
VENGSLRVLRRLLVAPELGEHGAAVEVRHTEALLDLALLCAEQRERARRREAEHTRGPLTADAKAVLQHAQRRARLAHAAVTARQVVEALHVQWHEALEGRVLHHV